MRGKLWGDLYMREEWIYPILLAGALLLLAVLALAIPAVMRWRQGGAPGQMAQATSAAPAPAQSAPTKVVKSPVAGSWYEGTADGLRAQVDGFIAKATAEPLADVIALIQPHAGYVYSAQTGAYGVKALEGKHFARVVVMGPSHRVPMENVASVSDAAAYASPLGEVALDVAFIAALKKHTEFRTVPGCDEGEHSVHIQIPLLQRAITDPFKLVPIVVGEIDTDTAFAMARILGALVDESTLVVASSDFTHYGANYGFVPFKDEIAANLEKLDMGAFDRIEKKDAKGFAAYCNDTGATICGRGPITILLAMLPADSAAHKLRYDQSGAMTADFTNSVSYLSVAFTGAWPKRAANEAAEIVAAPEPGGDPLSEADKAALLKMARSTIQYVLDNRKVPTIEELGIELSPAMKSTMGAFVTLKEHGELRGCIGEIIPRRPLYKAVMAQAYNAAFNDPRFPAVAAQEVADLHVEISAYAQPPKPIASYNDIVLGRDGIVLEKGGRSALFLPQVAPEQGWDLDETLTHLAMKAGLAPEDWKEGAQFSVFQAIVFGEKES